MPVQSHPDTKDPQQSIQETLAGLHPDQRTAFAVGMAERFLPVYAAFAKSENWGDPELLRSSIESVWGHLKGVKIPLADLNRRLSLIETVTPHMDDFEDAHEALAAAVMVHQALDSCRSTNNQEASLQTAISGCEAVVPGWSDDPAGRFSTSQKNALAKEFQQQAWLLAEVGRIQTFNSQSISNLRDQLSQKQHQGRAHGKRSVRGPTLLTNQTLFEQYRQMMEADIRASGQRWKNFETMPDMRPSLLFSRWAARYSRRKQTIDGSYGKPADVIAQQALVTRNRSIDAAAGGSLDWKPIQRSSIERSLANPYSGIDVKSIDEPHGYGPSVRRLWLEAKSRGLSNEESWEQLAVWAEHRPHAWEIEDSRKKSRLSSGSTELSACLSRPVQWMRTDDASHPWKAEVDGQGWEIRLNDFPDDYMYTLIVMGKDQGSFHDWPKNWTRE